MISYILIKSLRVLTSEFDFLQSRALFRSGQKRVTPTNQAISQNGLSRICSFR
ncbi:hypothetical protein AM1_0816 [Acaryochloris marina MBIC11017]|uniref:Uncharacterized protein n=1 Tax=Acaryochloris marina (strain MBIC 11017) TaxID=329726 RepID=B0BYH5_ACAM1|nr:hypothetical protein AM1_0816 [Acaryochloris marina MBIC11017]